MTKATILVVEDEGVVALSIQRKLGKLGYHVLNVAVSGEEAVEQAAQQRPDIVLMDIILSGEMDGVEAAQIIQQDLDIPVVYLTANSDERTLQRAKITEPFGYLLKPFEDRELHIALDMALYKHQAERELDLYRHQLEKLVDERTAELAETNANLRYQIKERKHLEERLEAVHQLGHELSLLHDQETIMKRVLETATTVLAFEVAVCGLVDKAAGRLEYNYGIPNSTGPSLPLNSKKPRGVSVAVVQSGRAINVPDIRQDDRYIPIADNLLIRSDLCVPMRVGDEVIGVLNVESQHLDRFSAADQQLLQTLADQAAVALENARLFDEVRRGQQRLRALSGRLVEVQESERRHLARELHDEVGQLLTGLKLLLEMSGSATGDVLKAHLKQALELVDDLTGQVQELSLNLRPSILDDLGLLPTLAWHFKRYTGQTDIEVDFRYIGPERRFDPTLETTVYRVVQEALTNAARYAQVSRVAVQLWVTDDRLKVRVEDQGCGFDLGSVLATASSSGLSGMLERVKLIGGDLSIESRPNQGTYVTAEFPLTEASAGRSGKELP